MLTRVSNMLAAAQLYGVNCPEKFTSLFEDDSEPALVPADTFRLARADDALDKVIDALIDKAGHFVGPERTRLPTTDEAHRIAKQLRKVIPAEDSQSLPDILNAAWELSEDTDLWAEYPQIVGKRDRVLRELVLKNIEVFEVERRLEGTQ